MDKGIETESNLPTREDLRKFLEARSRTESYSTCLVPLFLLLLFFSAAISSRSDLGAIELTFGVIAFIALTIGFIAGQTEWDKRVEALSGSIADQLCDPSLQLDYIRLLRMRTSQLSRGSLFAHDLRVLFSRKGVARAKQTFLSSSTYYYIALDIYDKLCKKRGLQPLVKFVFPDRLKVAALVLLGLVIAAMWVDEMLLKVAAIELSFIGRWESLFAMIFYFALSAWFIHSTLSTAYRNEAMARAIWRTLPPEGAG